MLNFIKINTLDYNDPLISSECILNLANIDICRIDEKFTEITKNTVLKIFFLNSSDEFCLVFASEFEFLLTKAGVLTTHA